MISYPSMVGNFVLRVTSAEVSEDSSLLAVGFADSIVKIWTLVPQKLRAMKSAEQLQDIDREAGKDFGLK
jgi:transcription initiation factor TFIID subunit 5